MGKISRIQLRGISRTPSDRLTEDGGCAESLNVSLDHSELAPSFIPEDVTKELGLPENLQADKVFVHKMLGKENVITVSQEVQAWEQGKAQTVCKLRGEEIVNDIVSIGNTVLVTTSERPIFILYKDGRYILLGESIPMPTIEFFDKQTQIYDIEEYDFAIDDAKMAITYPTILRSSSTKVQALRGTMVLDTTADGGKVKVGLDEASWNKTDADGYNANAAARAMTSELKAMYDDMKRINTEEEVLINPVWIMYGVRLYDGSLKMSVPYLLSGGVESPVDIYAVGGEFAAYAYYFMRLNHYYKPCLRLYDYLDNEIEQWKDIVKGIDIYMSEDINALDWKAVTIKQRSLQGEYQEVFAKMEVSGLKGSYMNYAMSCVTFTKVAEFAIDESFYPSGALSIDEIRQDYTIDMKGKILNEDRVNSGSLLSDEVYEFASGTYAGRSMVFNNRLLISDFYKDMTTGPRWLLSQRYNPYLPIPRIIRSVSVPYPSWWEATLPDESETLKADYRFTYYIDDSQGNQAVVYGRTVEEETRFTLSYDRYDWMGIKPLAFLLAIYPDQNCKKMDIRDSQGRTPHWKYNPLG